MSNKCPKGQRQRLDLPGRCPDKCEIDLGCDLPVVNSVEEIEVENLLEQIDNPGMENEALERLCKDVTEDMAYTKQRQDKGTY